jgi:hypothetical protein
MKFSAPLLSLALCFLGHLCAQEAATPNDNALFLAGLPIRDTPLAAFSYDSAWVDHATEFDKAWAELDARQLSKIRAWGPEFLGEAYANKRPLLYFFSGPDILYAQAFFPNASTYVLAGLEPTGRHSGHRPHAKRRSLAGGLARTSANRSTPSSASPFSSRRT